MGAVLTGLVLSGVAHAGSYDVASCASAPGAVNNGWTYAEVDTGNSHITERTLCPAGGDIFGGISAYDALGATDTPSGNRGEWSFAAPAGTTIVRWQYDRFLGKYNDNGWNVYARAASGIVFDTCTIDINVGQCSRGGFRDLGGLSATGLVVGFTCTNAGSCENGAAIHRVWASIYSSIVTVQDNVPPSVGPGTGPLLNTGAAHEGTESAAFGATDNTGIKATRVYIDGGLLAERARACDYTFPRPCTDEPGQPVKVDTTLVANGTHCVRLAAVDAADGETRGACTNITVANPGSPSGGGTAGGGTSTAPAPGDPTPVDPGTGLPPARAAPRLKVSSAKFVGSLLKVRGRIDAMAMKRVVLTYKVGSGRRARRFTVRATASSSGSFKAVFRIPPLLRGRAGVLTISYTGDAKLLAAAIRLPIFTRAT